MTDAEQITDAEVVSEAELVPVARHEALRPLDATDVLAAEAAYQELLPKLLDASDWQEFTERGQKKRFVKKSGWRKIARAFQLSVEVVTQTIDRDEEGNPLRAHTVARASAPNGQFSDGDGYCAVDERRFADQRARQKIENDLRATATTRAKNRAVADLVGMGEVSAEEVAVGGGDAAQPFGPVADKELLERATKAMLWLHGQDREAAETRWELAKRDHAGYMPQALAEGVVIAAEVVAERRAEAQANEQTTMEES